MSIENPEFIVMYNGKEAYPEKTTVRLSDLFKVKDGREPNLELLVTVYNVNAGYNSEIMSRSKTLDEYASFVAKVRDYVDNSGLNRTEAINKAVAECVKKGIMSEFLEKYGGDIVSILFREWNMDDALRVRAEEAREDMQEEIAEKLIKRETALEFIVDITGLSLEKVKKMAEKYNEEKKTIV